jgi:hypothetical protein
MDLGNEWLPENPKASGGASYFRLKDLKDYPNKSGDFRILCPFISGYEGWTEGNRPIRSQTADGFPADVKWRVENGRQEGPRPFWATVVWNYKEGKLQVWSFTQATIHRQLKELLDNKKWGALDAYDVTVSRKGDGTKTEYSVVPNPKEPLLPEAASSWAETKKNWSGLGVLFTNGHPLQESPTSVPF